MANVHDEYYEFVNGNIFVRKNNDGIIDVDELGTKNITPDIFIRNHNALPYDFGNKYLLEFDANGNPIGEWGGVASLCFETLKPKKEMDYKTLPDYLTFRRD